MTIKVSCLSRLAASILTPTRGPSWRRCRRATASPALPCWTTTSTSWGGALTTRVTARSTCTCTAATPTSGRAASSSASACRDWRRARSSCRLPWWPQPLGGSSAPSRGRGLWRLTAQRSPARTEAARRGRCRGCWRKLYCVVGEFSPPTWRTDGYYATICW